MIIYAERTEKDLTSEANATRAQIPSRTTNGIKLMSKDA